MRLTAFVCAWKGPQKCSSRRLSLGLIRSREQGTRLVSASRFVGIGSGFGRIGCACGFAVGSRAAPVLLVVHRGETSDLRVFEQIFVLDEYARLRDLTNVDLVLDLGRRSVRPRHIF